MATEAYNNWVAGVKAANGIVTRWPPNVEPSSNAGELAARYGASRYVLAPLTLRLLDTGAKASDALDIAKGDAVTTLTGWSDWVKDHLWILYALAALIAVVSFVRLRKR